MMACRAILLTGFSLLLLGYISIINPYRYELPKILSG